MNRIYLIGLDEQEYSRMANRLKVPVLAHETLPRIIEWSASTNRGSCG